MSAKIDATLALSRWQALRQKAEGARAAAGLAAGDLAASRERVKFLRERASYLESFPPPRNDPHFDGQARQAEIAEMRAEAVRLENATPEIEARQQAANAEFGLLREHAVKAARLLAKLGLISETEAANG